MKKIKTAVIGVGHLGRFHAQKYAALPDSDLVGVVDASAQRAAAVAAEVNTRAFSSYKDLLGLVDAVSIATPTEFHFDIGMELLSRGIDVLMEKPIASNGSEAGRLVEAAEKSGAVLQVGHLERFNPAVEALFSMKLKPGFIECSRLSPFPNRSTDIDVVLDMMIHDIEIIMSLAGAPVETVIAGGAPIVTGKADAAGAMIRFKNGCSAMISANRASSERVRRLRVYHDKGFVTVDYANQAITVSTLRRAEGSAFSAVTEQGMELQKKDTLLEEIRAFLKCSSEKSAPLVSGAQGKAALEVAEMVQDSIRRSHAGRTARA